MIESVMAILIISVMYAAALNTIGASRVSEVVIADQRKGHQLAQQLLAEIVMLPYLDPNSDNGALGVNGSEIATNRATFDDVDDYSQWTEGPPQFKDGTTMANLEEWKRVVEVAWVDPDDLARTRTGETGIKRIIVMVRHRSKTVATVQAIRAKVD